MRIETPRLIVRPFTLDDVEQIHDTYSDPRAGIPFPPGGTTASLEDTRLVVERIVRAYDAEDGIGVWAVELRSDGSVIGDCGLFRCSDPWAAGELEIAYRYRPASWGLGYATEAARAALAYAFERLRAPRVVADANPGNLASLRVLEKIGMSVVGERKDPEHPALFLMAEAPTSDG